MNIKKLIIENRKRLVWLSVIIFGVYILLTAGFAAASYYKSDKLLEEADQLMAQGKYADAVNKYGESGKLWKFDNDLAVSKTTEAKLLIVEDENFKLAEANYTLSEWQKCIDNLAQVTEKYFNHTAAKSRSLECQTKLLEAQERARAEAEAAAIAKAKADAEAAAIAKAKAAAAAAKKSTGTAPSTSSTTKPFVPNYNSISNIVIKGDDNCRNQTFAALNLLNERDLEALKIVEKYIGTIECIDKGSGMYSWENPPRFVVGTVTMGGGTMWYAGSILHDSWHSKLYNDYHDAHPNDYVPAEIYSGETGETICVGHQYDTMVKLGADQGTLDWIKASLATKYWEVPYDQRSW
jgi:hypothetical protein